MIQRWNCRAAAWAVAIILCAVGLTPRLLAQDAKQDLIEQTGWELSTGRIDAALRHAQQGVTEYPKSAVLMHLLGAAQAKKGLQKEARQSFQSSIRLDPTIPQNYYDLAVLDMQDGNYSEAAGMLKTYLGVIPQNGKAHLLLGLAYQKQNDERRALAEFKQAQTLSPDLPMLHYYLGRSYEEQGDPKDALAEFKKELSANPSFYGLDLEAGKLELAQQDYKAAEKFFRQGIALRPLHYEAYFGLAKALLGLQEPAQAASQLETVIALEPQDIEAHALLARLYEKMGKTMEAKREDLAVETLRAANGDSKAGGTQH